MESNAIGAVIKNAVYWRFGKRDEQDFWILSDPAAIAWISPVLKQHCIIFLHLWSLIPCCTTSEVFFSFLICVTDKNNVWNEWNEVSGKTVDVDEWHVAVKRGMCLEGGAKVVQQASRGRCTILPITSLWIARMSLKPSFLVRKTAPLNRFSCFWACFHVFTQTHHETAALVCGTQHGQQRLEKQHLF